MRRSDSIRARLLAGILVSLVAILGVAAISAYLVGKHEAEELFGARLATSARVLEALVAKQLAHATVASPIVITLPRELEAAQGDAGTPLGHPYETKIAFQVWHGDGTLLARSQSAPALPFSAHQAGFSRQAVDGVDWQVFVLRSGAIRIQVAEKDEVRDELIHDLGLAVMTPLVVGAALLLAIANVLVRYGLAPLRELAARIQAREPNALGSITLRHVPRELAPVVDALNDLLDRIRVVLARERRFTDAAAHELRTPLAALKIHADNLARAGTDVERARSLALLSEGLTRAIKLTTQLLAYSRIQDEEDREPRTRIRLAAVVGGAIASLEPLWQQRDQRIAFETDAALAAAAIEGEPTKIERLVLNLIDNASRYAPRGTSIDISLAHRGEHLQLAIANAGTAIPADLRERVFEPYYRLPGSGSEGSGLGLAIVQEIADRHHAAITLGTRDDGTGTRVIVSFACLPPEEDARG